PRKAAGEQCSQRLFSAVKIVAQTTLMAKVAKALRLSTSVLEVVTTKSLHPSLFRVVPRGLRDVNPLWHPKGIQQRQHTRHGSVEPCPHRLLRMATLGQAPEGDAK
ncbi:MAG: hypothetical protein ABI068_11275, partial [Ktedonobacterales bacterium]